MGLLGVVAAAGPALADDPGRLPDPFRLHDPAIVESSSLVVSRTTPGVVYTANDGPSRQVYVVDMASGDTVATTTLVGVRPVDVEAMAAGPSHSLYIADIGDNDRARKLVRLYRIPEPGRTDAAVRPRTYRLSYADRPHDAEALLVQPHSGRVYIPVKQVGSGIVYASSRRLSTASVNRLRPIASAIGPVTDGAFLPHGRTALLRTYGTVAAYRTPGWWRERTWPLPQQPQGESLAVLRGGRGGLIGTEGPNSRVVAVALPGLRRPEEKPTPSPAATPGPRTGDAPLATVPIAAAGALGLAAVVGLAVALRRRH